MSQYCNWYQLISKLRMLYKCYNSFACCAGPRLWNSLRDVTILRCPFISLLSSTCTVFGHYVIARSWYFLAARLPVPVVRAVYLGHLKLFLCSYVYVYLYTLTRLSYKAPGESSWNVLHTYNTQFQSLVTQNRTQCKTNMSNCFTDTDTARSSEQFRSLH